jgi:neutral amino acid transport system substrate-binding protein
MIRTSKRGAIQRLPETSALFSARTGAIVLGFLACASGCEDSNQQATGPTIEIGASLPYTGREAALGRNIEQAMLLAIEDVNRFGGVNGTPLSLVSKDSNSGSERGLDDLLSLLYDRQVAFLIGPEENDLAGEIVADIKSLDVFNILPGYAAPAINRSTRTGAWLKLAPSTFAMGCALAMHALDDDVATANTLASQEDYNANLASAFGSIYRQQGKLEPSVTLQANQTSFSSTISRARAPNPERTLLIAYPAEAATVVTEWSITNGEGDWYLSPLLHAEVFLSNVPYGSLDGAFGLSPSVSLTSECEIPDVDYGNQHVDCERNNHKAFTRHFAERWDGTKPFPAANLYYDAVVLLALGMQYVYSTSDSAPNAKSIQRAILKMNVAASDAASWRDLGKALERTADGTPVRYVGAGAEYEFDEFGTAKHSVFDAWSIEGQEFVSQGQYFARCLKPD